MFVGVIRRSGMPAVQRRRCWGPGCLVGIGNCQKGTIYQLVTWYTHGMRNDCVTSLTLPGAATRKRLPPRTGLVRGGPILGAFFDNSIG